MNPSPSVIQERVRLGFAAVQLYCDSRIPEDLRDEIRIECELHGDAITIVESRPPWNPDLSGGEWTNLRVAQLRYDPSGGTWSLRYADRNSRWRTYEGIERSDSVDRLLQEIDADPSGIFWG